MPTGHTDAQRRERILTAALDFIAEEGIQSVSHRKIAARAGVPLGSMTYYFSGMDELLRAAFRHFMDHIMSVFDAHLRTPADPDQARQAVADLVYVLSTGDRRDVVLTQELCTLSARRPAYRELTNEWMRRSRVHLEKHFDPDTSRQLTALITGLILHHTLSRQVHDQALTVEAISRITTTARSSH
ncbi:TetR/AcrR family transcriptional regulator [Streptomyces sp. NPDC057621]|uniref:TetR/AcrR family transcriptional regulator n=1 Tax=Streptomyces sp. NPDC057621 TaxID=3346186 RepID=UPI0036AE7098